MEEKTELQFHEDLDILNNHLGDTIELTLTIAELLDLIECGALANNAFDWNPPIVAEIHKLFTMLCENIIEAADEV